MFICVKWAILTQSRPKNYASLYTGSALRSYFKLFSTIGHNKQRKSIQSEISSSILFWANWEILAQLWPNFTPVNSQLIVPYHDAQYEKKYLCRSCDTTFDNFWATIGPKLSIWCKRDFFGKCHFRDFYLHMPYRGAKFGKNPKSRF